MLQTVKGFVADHFGDLAPSDIPNFLFALFLTAVLNLLLVKLYRKYGGGSADHLAGNLVLIGIGSAVLAAIVKHSLPLALAAIALLSIIRVRDANVDMKNLTYMFLSILIGIGCGAGYGLIMIMAFVVLALFIVLTGSRSQNP